jgi:excisionase family DNA binding protein
MQPVEQYLKLRDAASVMQVSLATIRRWVDAGELPVMKFGDAKNSPVRIRRSDLDAFAARHRAPSAFGYKRPHTVEGVA